MIHKIYTQSIRSFRG